MKRILLLVLFGCVDRGPGPPGKKIEPSYIRENTLTAVPEGIQRLDVELGGKVTYLGNKLAYIDNRDPKTPLAPGQTIRVFHYWQVKQPIDKRWRVFAFVRGAPNTADFMNLGPTDMEIGLPPHKWKAGQIIQDVQDITLRPDWRSPMATVYIGFVEEGKHQLGDRMAASGPNVADRAVIARAIAVDLSKAPPPAGTVYVPYTSGGITVDGTVVDPAWGTAAASVDFINADGSPDPVGKATARMAWDEQNLYVFVQVADSDVFSPYKQHDEPLWKADCVELFIDADGNRSGYVELQVNPNNATFDSYFATTRAQPGDEKWESGMQTAVKVRGTPDKSGDADQGWDVEIAIPLAAVKGKNDAMGVRLPPQVGDKWRLNVVRVDYRSGGGGPGVASWNRISYSDFHALDRMLTVVFADRNGSISPTSDPAGSAAPPAGSAAPSAGSAAPSAGSAAPAPNIIVPPMGSAVPAPNVRVPPAGSAAPTKNTPAPPAGSAAPTKNTPAPPAGSAAPTKNTPAPPAGSAAPTKNTTAPPSPQTGSAAPKTP